MSHRRSGFFVASVALAVGFATVAAPSGSALAERYVSLGTGSTALGGDLQASFDDESSGAYRLAMGQRFGPLALEASIFGSDFAGSSPEAGNGDFSTFSLGVDLKYHLGLLGPVEGYLKAGLNKTWLSSSDERPYDHRGTGYDLGVGVQWNLNLGAISGALWLDFTHYETELRSPEFARTFDGALGVTMIGASIGF